MTVFERAGLWRQWMLCQLLVAIDEGANMTVKTERLRALRDADDAERRLLADWESEERH